MNPFYRAAILAALLAVALVAQALVAQAPVAAPAPAETPRTRVRGQVVDARSQLPVKGGRVVIGVQGDATATAETDFEGRFDFTAPAGDQPITVYKSAYRDSRNRIRIPAGREIQGVRIEMHRTAAITGRVIAPDGLPMTGARVRVLKRTYVDGVPFYAQTSPHMFSGATTSDDRGVFRAWGLSPGACIVAVDPVAEPGPRGVNVISASGLYFPNVHSLAEASRVHVDWDQVQENVDIELQPPPDTRVEGVVRMGAGGGNCQNCSGEIHRREGDVWISFGDVTIGRDGVFSIAGLAPGNYVLTVQSFDRRSSSMNFGNSEFNVFEGRTTPVLVDVFGEQPVEGRLVLEDPPSKVVSDERMWQEFVQFRQRFGDPLSAPTGRGSVGKVMGKGNEAPFSLSPVAGRHTFHLDALFGAGYVRDISIGGRPVEGRDITVPPGGINDLTIFVAFDSGAVSGRVTGGETPVVDAGLLPPLRLLWLIPQGVHARFVNDLSGSVKPDGSFEIEGLPPGVYRAFAVPEETGRLMGDPAAAVKLARWSKAVEVRAGQSMIVNLELAPRLATLE